MIMKSLTQSVLMSELGDTSSSGIGGGSRSLGFMMQRLISSDVAVESVMPRKTNVLDGANDIDGSSALTTKRRMCFAFRWKYRFTRKRKQNDGDCGMAPRFSVFL